VFDNRFPSLSLQAHDAPLLEVPTAPSIGQCEVVVFTQDRESALGRLPLDHIELLLEVWGERTRDLGAREEIRYVLPFENRGAEVGVTLHHPHGQIYAYPVVPPVPARMQEQAAAYLKEKGRGPLQDLVRHEMEEGKRLLYRGPHAAAFVPVCARYPYEVWVAPIEPVPTLADLSREQRADLARALKTVLMKYDGLWQRPFPYLMAWYQAAFDGQPHPEAHVHAQFYPPYRTPDRLKYLAGTELAAGFFAMDALPEDKALELQAVPVDLGDGGSSS
jgi:UDPglucose--hexose-1-phosphate uridylyltransferase